jgi:hypothetical protein
VGAPAPPPTAHRLSQVPGAWTQSEIGQSAQRVARPIGRRASSAPTVERPCTGTAPTAASESPPTWTSVHVAQTLKAGRLRQPHAANGVASRTRDKPSSVNSVVRAC